MNKKIAPNNRAMLMKLQVIIEGCCRIVYRTTKTFPVLTDELLAKPSRLNQYAKIFIVFAEANK